MATCTGYSVGISHRLSEHFLVTWLCVFLASCTIAAAETQSLVEPPAPQSPHWSHINIFDFARALSLGTPSTSEVEWMTSHVDVVEASGNERRLRSLNPTIKFESYQLDQSIIQRLAKDLTDESWFLHHSEDTTLEFWSLDRSTHIKTVRIPGCPRVPVFECRVQAYLWNDPRYIFNLSTPSLRTWLKDRIISQKNAYGQDISANDYIWIDEHAPGFQWPFSYNFQTIIQSGGAVRELRNLNPSTDIEEIGFLYNSMVVDWLTYFSPYATAAGKKVLINANAQVLYPEIEAQISVVKGFDTESLFHPDGIVSPTDFWSLANRVAKSVAAGGWVSLHGIWGNPVPDGYTEGNYTSPMARNLMWRLMGYYCLKEPVDSPGIVYFNPAFPSNNSMRIEDDIAEWLPANQVNVGQPSDSLRIHQTGAVAGQPYTIFGRPYTRGLVLVRPKDCKECTDYGDTSAAPVRFAMPVQMLRADGTLTKPTTVVPIRNAEAVFLFPSKDTSQSHAVLSRE